MAFQIRYALGGGFGGAKTQEWESVEAESMDEANKIAYELACEVYDGYAGLHGLRDVEQIMEEDELDDREEAWETYVEERDGWIDYEVKKV